MRGDLVNAEKAYRAAIKTGYLHPAIFSNLGVICKNSERKDGKVSLKTSKTADGTELTAAFTQ